jgi:hypothetical protein
MTEIFVGVGSLFKLFGDGSVVGFDLGTLPYPPVRYRQYISMTGFCDYLKLAGDMALYNLSRQVFAESSTAIELAFPNFTKGELPVDGLSEIVSAKGRDYIQRLYEEWQNRVRGELLPYSYAEFLP